VKTIKLRLFGIEIFCIEVIEWDSIVEDDEAIFSGQAEDPYPQ
jgi:hypothetical protein